MSFRPRESCERSRRPSGASGGAAGAGFGARAILMAGDGFGPATAFAAAGILESGEATGGFVVRALLRSGLVCFATLSQSARSSSLSARLRRGGDNSGIEVEDERFIGRGGTDRHDRDDGGAFHGLA